MYRCIIIYIHIPFYSQVLNSMVAASPCVPSLPRAGVRLRPRSGARSDEPIRIPPAFFGLTLGYWPSNFGPISSCMDLTLILKIPYLSWRSFLAILLGNLGRSSRSSRTTESERFLNKKDHSDSLETQNEPPETLQHIVILSLLLKKHWLKAHQRGISCAIVCIHGHLHYPIGYPLIQISCTWYISLQKKWSSLHFLNHLKNQHCTLFKKNASSSFFVL